MNDLVVDDLRWHWDPRCNGVFLGDRLNGAGIVACPEHSRHFAYVSIDGWIETIYDSDGTIWFETQERAARACLERMKQEGK